jgi:outer membrane protein assembly factor BamB
MIPAGALFLLAATLSAADVKPGEWPQWRGPNRDAKSTETGLLKQWPKDGPALLWTSKGLGRGMSSIAIAGGKIFTMGDRGKDPNDKAKDQYLIALNLADGKELWVAKIGAGWGDRGPRCTPTVDGNLVYAISPHGDLVCCQTADGKEVWRKNLKTDFKGNMMSGWGYSESPLIDGDLLVCTPGGKEATLAALNKKTGETVWKSQVPEGDGAGYASIVIAEVGGVKQYITTLGRGIVGVAAKDGKFLWRYNKIANGTANIPTAIVKGDQVFCSTGYGTGAALLKIVPQTNGGFKADEVYFLKGNEFQNHHGGMILIGDYVYAGNQHNQGFPICVEFATGKITWKKDRGPGSGSAAVVYADGNLYFRYESGLMALIEATPQGYSEKGTFKIPDVSGPSWPHPVVAGGKLYLREGNALLCYNLKQ